MDINIIRGVLTVILFVLFLVFVFKVYSPKQKGSFKEASMLPFEDGATNMGDIKSDE